MAGEGERVAAKRDIGAQIETMVGESRVMLTALAVLFGFQLNLSFTAGFERMPAWAVLANFGALTATALAIIFLLSPVGYHRLTNGLDESYGFLHMQQRNMGAAFTFMAASLVLSLLVQAQRAFDDTVVAVAVALATLALALVAWWIMPFWRAQRRGTFARRWLPHEDPDHSESRRGHPRHPHPPD